MERQRSKTGLVNTLALLAGGAVLGWVALYAKSSTAELSAAFFGIGALVSLASWFQMRLEIAEENERVEVEALQRSRGSTLFSGSDLASFTARKAREQFEKWLAPIFTFLLCSGQGAGAWYFYGRLKTGVPTEAAPEPTLAMAAAFGVALTAFLLGKFSARLAQLENLRLLRPAGAALLLGAMLAAVTGGTATADWFGFAKVDYYAAWVLTGLLALITFETLVSLIFEQFRPRTKGQVSCVLYESRLVGVLAESGDLFKTAAHALDYQFGFSVSETWVYAFFRDNLAALVGFWVVLLAFCSCFVVIEPAEQGLKERFGSPVGEPLEPGLHLKLPWPIDDVVRVNARGLQSFNVGFVADPKLENERVVIWTRPHYLEEINMLVASREQTANAAEGDAAVPVNLLTVSIPVQFYIRDAKLWAYKHENAGDLLQHIANREVVRYLASVDMDKVMSFGRLQAARDLRDAIQRKADGAELGVEIVFVGLQDIHPPIGQKRNEVASAYEKVIGAEAEREATVLEAEGYAAENLPGAKAEGVRRRNEAQAYAARKVSLAAGQAAEFAGERAALASGPNVYPDRSRLAALTDAIKDRRKLIVGVTNTHDVIILNLEEKIRSSLADDIVVDNPDSKK
jgi:modulator of FtsH protease HflK